ncbi:MAG: Si-specific NAD(P)(+) transhydrogenase [Nitrospirales bacterium]|nr:Si-specific NAD(P)(+) transhydrogenase [Nitrospirales bacterium]MDR4481774.1 Si-specific NAD(P)(+) transhydrogenase [Nitrospirales bacterium]
MTSPTRFDLIVIGSGPAGQKAAIQGAKAGKQVALIEQTREVGGACVYQGTIPSKTLRESALQMVRFLQATEVFEFRMRDDVKITTLMTRLNRVVQAHGKFMKDQLTRNDIDCFHGRAAFVSDREVRIQKTDGTATFVTAPIIVIATGSRPRVPANIPIDHEHILDSDSILSLVYLPKSLIVLGGGVIASEYASIFALLGVHVTMVDTADRPLKFLDQELTDEFCGAFEQTGGHYRGGQRIDTVRWDGCSHVTTVLENGETLESEKMLVALGRVSNLDHLNLEATGIHPTTRGLISVNNHCQTAVPHIYAVGDVIGPPSLASCSMEQGRRAVCHGLGLDPGSAPEQIPMGIYTIPEMSSVGISEQEAINRYGGATVGRARFHEIARGQISGMTNGLLKMVADPKGEQLLGIHIVGEGATELIHIGQMGLLHHMPIDRFIDNIFNFPTLAEAYRVAALDIAKQRQH